MKTKQSMSVRVLVVGVYCLVAAAVLTEVQPMKTKERTRSGVPTSSPSLTPPARTGPPVTSPTEKSLVPGGSSQANATTNESISSQTTTAAMHETETTSRAAMTTVSTMYETANQSSSITTPTVDTESEQTTLVMAIVGSVVGLLILLVVMVSVITICTAAASRQKIKTAPGLNNIDHSLDNPTYNKVQQDVESGVGGAKPTEGHIYHILERSSLQPPSAHAYEIVDCETEDDSSTGGVSQSTTNSSCNSSSETHNEKKRCAQHEYEIVSSFNNGPRYSAPRSRLSNYDHLIEKDGGATNQRRHSLNERSFNTATHEYDTLDKAGMIIQNTIKTSDDYSALEVHGYAVLRPHSSCTRPPGGRDTSTTQDGEYSHLMHH